MPVESPVPSHLRSWCLLACGPLLTSLCPAWAPLIYPWATSSTPTSVASTVIYLLMTPDRHVPPSQIISPLHRAMSNGSTTDASQAPCLEQARPPPPQTCSCFRLISVGGSVIHQVAYPDTWVSASTPASCYCLYSTHLAPVILPSECD